MDARIVTLDLGDGFPATLTIEQARAVRSCLSAVTLIDNSEYNTNPDEQHSQAVEGVKVWCEVSTRSAVDVDAPLDLDVLDFPASNGTIFSGAK